MDLGGIDLEVAVLLGVLGLLAVNQLVMRVGALTGSLYIFYGIQLVNVLVGSAIIWFGLPGMEQWLVVSWFVGLLFFFHTVQNTSHRSQWLREQSAAQRGTLSEQAEALRAALEAGEAMEE